MSALIVPKKSIKPFMIPDLQREHLIQDKRYSKTTSAPRPFHDGLVTDSVLAAAKKYPNDPAIRSPRLPDKTYREVTYAQLVHHANEIAKVVSAKVDEMGGGYADNFIGILLPRDIEFFESALGIWLTGAAYLPLYSNLPPDRMEWYLEDSGARIVITSRELDNHLIPFYKGEYIYIEDIMPNFISKRQAMSLKIPSFDHLKSRISNRNLAYMIYTSGTTGKPKGVEVEHRGVVNMLTHHANILCDEKDLQKSAIVAALIFDSSIRETWIPLVTGGCLCIAENVFGINEGSMCAGTPSGLTVATFPEQLSTVMVGGERLTDGCVSNINVHHEKKIINAYGPTETTVECLMHITDTKIPEEISWIGVPIWNTHIYGVPQNAKPDPETGAFPLAKRGDPCELFVGGVGVARGYRNAPQKTADKFLPNNFGEGGMVYRTGDLVRWTKNGDLEYLGRTDSQVKLRGFRIELEEVERNCSETEGVGAAAVLIKKDKRQQEHLIAYVTPDDEDEELNEPQQRALIDAVLKYTASKMPEYMVPSEIVVMESFPFTIGGKVDKRSLPEPDWGSTQQPGQPGPSDSDGDVVGPSNQTEEIILNVICDMLDVPENMVSVTDDLFTEYGLTSIDAALLRRKLMEKGMAIDGTATILRHGTVRGLSNFLQGANNDLEETILETVGEMLDVAIDTIAITDNIFTDYGLTSIEAALLRRNLIEKGIEIDGTAAILRAGTVKAIAKHIADASGGDQKGALKAESLNIKDIQHDKALDKPLPKLLVWILTLLGFFLACMITYATPVFLWIMELSIVHRMGRCRWEGLECDNPDPWLGFWYNVAFTPVVLVVLFFLELFIVWAVKWAVIGRYKRGTYSIWGPMYLRWWFVHTFMTFTYFFLLNPLRCTGLLNMWYRALGAKIGKNVVLDTVAIYEPDLVEIGDNVTVQSDAAIFGHNITRRVA